VLFELLAAQPLGACIGIVVPIVLVGFGAPLAARGRPVAVSDHVNLTLRSPLSGRWPGGTERVFPPLTGIYQPAVVRARGGARVYSTGVVVAGVTDAGRLTPFEARAVVEGGCAAVSDTLVPAAVIAAYHGLKLAACGVPQGSAND
jgi:purine nucleoside phosphorylase